MGTTVETGDATGHRFVLMAVLRSVAFMFVAVL